MVMIIIQVTLWHPHGCERHGSFQARLLGVMHQFTAMLLLIILCIHVLPCPPENSSGRYLNDGLFPYFK